MSDDPIPAAHPDRYALEYIDAKIAAYKVRSTHTDKPEAERNEYKAVAQAFGILHADILTLLHRPDPVIITVCEHDPLADVDTYRGDVWRCRKCQEVTPRVRETDASKVD